MAACGGGRASGPVADSSTGETTPAEAAAPDTTFPVAQRGTLIARSVLPGPLGGTWKLEAGVCHQPPTLQLRGLGDSVDVMLLLQLPAQGAATGTYVIAAPDDTVAASRTARLGVQKVLYADVAYRGERGSVELNRLDDLVSGRFDVVLRDDVSADTVRYLGVFDRIPVDSLSGPACRAAERGVPPEAP